jgi:hypothetical protein
MLLALAIFIPVMLFILTIYLVVALNYVPSGTRPFSRAGGCRDHRYLVARPCSPV